MGKNYYISDLHFGHFNIIRYDNRPFKSVEEMDKTLIDNWNRRVLNEDTVYILGDISWWDISKTIDIFSKLRGHKVLIKGNHDRIPMALGKYFDRVVDYLEITDGAERVVMSHYPMPFWNGQFRDTIHLYGHIHNSHQWNVMQSWRKELRQLQDIPMRMYNVGCMIDYMNYTPRTLNEILTANK